MAVETGRMIEIAVDMSTVINTEFSGDQTSRKSATECGIVPWKNYYRSSKEKTASGSTVSSMTFVN